MNTDAAQNMPTDHTDTPTSMTQRLLDLLSLLLLLLSAAVCFFGLAATGNYLLSRPAANILVNEGQLGQAEQQHVAQMLSDRIEGNFFTADIMQLQSAVMDIDWIKAVRITRQWPNGLVVDAVPRHPVARFGSTRFLSQDGIVFEPLHTQMTAMRRADLPMMYGPSFKAAEMMQQYRQVNDWFDPLNMHLTEVSLTDRMTWFFKFNTGLRVIVDRENTQAKLYQLSILSQTQLQPVWSDIASVDLRYRNGMAVLWRNNKKPAGFN